eukprot:CAMPEP_0172075960 /NCGR_PEP_ID=MMETSP1043-20130122/16238_1 /TAXON_ID=464988 /ORGANISM="Hemiselmis andersenii, Strain CCMP441" /LENGTH=57 /DNA_ID=CAMNT_0012736751 /DNA_START=26 /DNA_END=199 /DNA_ORIENTATION=-
MERDPEEGREGSTVAVRVKGVLPPAVREWARGERAWEAEGGRQQPEMDALKGGGWGG